MFSVVLILLLCAGAVYNFRIWLDTPACGPECESGNHANNRARAIAGAGCLAAAIILAVVQ